MALASPSISIANSGDASIALEADVERLYHDGLPNNVAMQLRHELNLIDRLGYAPYFLTVESIVRFARSKSILCQGRGPAANSAVCFVLGVNRLTGERAVLHLRFPNRPRASP
jgi:error-prone DNA polymerase